MAYDPLATAPEGTAQAVRCTWCRGELAPGDAKPILHARLPGVPDEENTQCKDDRACDLRQDALDAAVIVRARAEGLHPAFGIRVTPGVRAALDDGERLREAMANLEAGHG